MGQQDLDHSLFLSTLCHTTFIYLLYPIITYPCLEFTSFHIPVNIYTCNLYVHGNNWSTHKCVTFQLHYLTNNTGVFLKHHLTTVS